MNAHPASEEIAFEATERAQTQLPALALLARLGFHYLTREQALALRGGKTTRVLLEDVLRTQLGKINQITFRGKTHPFTEANLRRGIQALESVSLAEGPQGANEKVYDLLRLGKSLEQTLHTEKGNDTKSFTLRYIDWEHPENNVYHATTEYAVRRAGSQKLCYLDIVLFVNGIPLVVIECKEAGIPLGEAIDDILAYQSQDYIPELFKYVQIVLATNRQEAKYATAGTQPKFWAVWKNRAEDIDPKIEALLKQPLVSAEREALAQNFVREASQLYAAEQQGRKVTEQDWALYNLCRPERLLELTAKFILYDGGDKKIARYQQYDAVKKAMARIQHRHRREARDGGVIWHTQGSGKSLTMVMLANAIATAPDITNPRIILVTDRIDLDKQIAATFQRCGLAPQRATSGADLRALIQTQRGSVITTLVQKFVAAIKQEEVTDTSPEIFVLVDESHRSHYGTMQTAMRRIFPNACYLGFTGTPLLAEERSTIDKFGGLIDVYTMEQAVKDEAVVPLLYERRHVVQEVNEGPIDTWFERRTASLTEEQKRDLKKKYSRSEPLIKTEQRLATIAEDVAAHYHAHWQQEGYYKAQLVAPGKRSAILLHKFLNETGKVTSEVIISPPDEREGVDEEEDESTARIVGEFWKKTMERFGNSETRYNEETIARFNSAADPEILIVVDKLITGFDVPRNTVLYLARPLKEHTLLQAIARVNRLYSGKDYGFILDYYGVLGELDQALSDYAALAGYDPAEIEGTIHSIREPLARLPQAHAELLNLFKTIYNKSDEEEYEQFLFDRQIRDDFYVRLTDFSKCLKIALSTELFFKDAFPNDIDRYKADLKRFQNLRASVQRRYAEVVDLKDLEPQITKLLDTYVFSDSVEVLTPEPINIFDTDAMEMTLAALSNPAAQADTMANAMARTITERMDQDPAFYRKFSEMIRETIQAFRDHLLSEMEYLKHIREIRSQVTSRSEEQVPARLAGNDIGQAYYRTVLEHLDQVTATPGDQETAVDIALMIDSAVRPLAQIVDWTRKDDITNKMRSEIDDGFFALSEQGKIKLEWSALDEITTEALKIAKSRTN